MIIDSVSERRLYVQQRTTVLANTEPFHFQEVYLHSFNQNLGPVLPVYRVEGSENTIVSVHIALLSQDSHRFSCYQLGRACTELRRSETMLPWLGSMTASFCTSLLREHVYVRAPDNAR